MYYYIKSVLLWVFMIETRVCVGIWSCDKLSHKSPFEASQAIKTGSLECYKKKLSPQITKFMLMKMKF